MKKRWNTCRDVGVGHARIGKMLDVTPTLSQPIYVIVYRVPPLLSCDCCSYITDCSRKTFLSLSYK